MFAFYGKIHFLVDPAAKCDHLKSQSLIKSQKVDLLASASTVKYREDWKVARVCNSQLWTFPTSLSSIHALFRYFVPHGVVRQYRSLPES